jgi:hypothetical protein
MAMAADRGVAELSLLRGTEPHKYRLSPNHVQSVRIVLADGMWGAVGLGAVGGRRVTTKAVKRLMRRWAPASAPAPSKTLDPPR